MYRIKKFSYRPFLLQMFVVGLFISIALYTYVYLRYVLPQNFSGADGISDYFTGSEGYFNPAFFIWIEQFNIVWMIMQVTFVFVYNRLATKTGGFVVEVESVVEFSELDKSDVTTEVSKEYEDSLLEENDS